MLKSMVNNKEAPSSSCFYCSIFILLLGFCFRRENAQTPSYWNQKARPHPVANHVSFYQEKKNFHRRESSLGISWTRDGSTAPDEMFFILIAITSLECSTE